MRRLGVGRAKHIHSLANCLTMTDISPAKVGVQNES